MDKEKLLKKIEENKKLQVDKYVKSIKMLVKEHKEYYKDKKYAEKFKD